MSLKKLVITIFSISILFISSAYSKNINIELISYKEKRKIQTSKADVSQKSNLRYIFIS